MAERWQAAEGRSAAVYFEDATVTPPAALTGLACTAVTAFKDGTAGAPAGTVTEVAFGFYRVDLAAAPAKDVLVRVYGGATAGYVALEVPVGGYVNNVDATTSSRSSSAAVSALGAPAQAAAVTALGSPAQAAAVTALGSPAQAGAVTALGAPAQASALATAQADLTTLVARVTATRAAALDFLDVAVSSRTASATWTNARAALLDQIALLDAAVSTRARPQDVQVTVTTPPRGEVGP